jgi:2-oxoglutarate ferredoxin oxidoreductase subunit gamma
VQSTAFWILCQKKILESAVLDRVPKGTEELNKLALKKGYELVENCNRNKLN